MKKFLCFTFVALFATTEMAFAAWSTGNFKMGDNKTCFVDTYEKKRFLVLRKPKILV